MRKISKEEIKMIKTAAKAGKLIDIWLPALENRLEEGTKTCEQSKAIYAFLCSKKGAKWCKINNKNLPKKDNR